MAFKRSAVRFRLAPPNRTPALMRGGFSLLRVYTGACLERFDKKTHVILQHSNAWGVGWILKLN